MPRGLPFPKKGEPPTAASLAREEQQLTPTTALTLAQKSIEVRKITKGLRAQVRAMQDEIIARGWEPNVLLILLQIANEGYSDEVRIQAARALAPYLETKLPTIIKGLGEQRAPATPEMQERVAGTLSAIAAELRKANNG